MKFRTRYDEDENEVIGLETAIESFPDGMTIQEPTEDTDINVLMKRMGIKDGSELPRFDNPKALYGDFSEMPTDPVELANIMREGQINFMKIPAEIRQRYETPEALFKFMNDDSNYDEAVKLGLLAKKEPPVKSQLDLLVDKIDTMVSSSTSSDKEQLVPPGARAPKPSNSEK